MAKYFTIEELCRSNTAERNKIDNTPIASVKVQLNNLIENILDPLRQAYGHPIVVSSGYRCPKLNSIIGGARTSQHCLGQAADIRSKSDSREENGKLFRLIRELKLPFDQLIDEKNMDWVHVSFSPRHRRQVLKMTVVNGKTVYTKVQ